MVSLLLWYSEVFCNWSRQFQCIEDMYLKFSPSEGNFKVRENLYAGYSGSWRNARKEHFDLYSRILLSFIESGFPLSRLQQSTSQRGSRWDSGLLQMAFWVIGSEVAISNLSGTIIFPVVICLGLFCDGPVPKLHFLRMEYSKIRLKRRNLKIIRDLRQVQKSIRSSSGLYSIAPHWYLPDTRQV